MLGLANRLRPLLLRLNRELRRELAPLGVTGGQATLLHLIDKERGIGIGELATREGISSAAISGHVDRLAAAGLVRRVPSTADRRRVGLELTDKGAQVLRAVRRRRTAWLAARLERLSTDELAALEKATGPLARLLEEDG